MNKKLDFLTKTISLLNKVIPYTNQLVVLSKLYLINHDMSKNKCSMKQEISYKNR